ncbi:MAG: hypothetical protein COA63_011055 [Methylophaga sp.]|nr:hypothetical protein [Methylophaga sp.]
MPKAILLSDQLIADAKSRGEAESLTASEQIESWAQLGKHCEENPDLPTPLVKAYIDGLEDDLDDIAREMFQNPDDLRDLFQELAPSFNFDDNSEPRATVEYLFHLFSTRLKETTEAVRKIREKLDKSI